FCVTVNLPNGWSGTAGLFVESCPQNECNFGLLAGFIANLKDGSGAPLYHNAFPDDFFTIDIVCDRTVCKGGSLQNYVISIDPDDVGGTYGFIDSPACTSSVNHFVAPYQVVSQGQTFCTDYNWAHRDNNQDTWLRVRAADIDAKGKM
ncbi:MAG TPA: hypothetical protein VF984_10085, partial [Actinomycetota bacterium]